MVTTEDHKECNMEGATTTALNNTSEDGNLMITDIYPSLNNTTPNNGNHANLNSMEKKNLIPQKITSRKR
eukprot:4553372-Ditylum_brightwellii.AAC.1